MMRTAGLSSGFLRFAVARWLKHNARVPENALCQTACLLGCALLVGCAGNDRASTDARQYRVLWSAERVSDHLALSSASARVSLGGTVRVGTVQRPSEERPAITEFLAKVQRGPKPGVIEVISRTSVTEETRNPKGKLKRQKRVIGALIPMRVGERQLSSSPSDPVAVTLQLERAPSRE